MKYIYSFFIIFLSLCAGSSFARTIAFPGAEGAGKFTRGGRGGDVYEVTNLNDDGPGSLREAIEASGPRTVVFRVSGTIELESDLKIKSPYITIAGQTAPGDGICIKDHTLYVNHNEVIIRFIRFRLGDESDSESDAMWGRYAKNVIIDHCSASWSVDEALSIYGIDSLTVQWNIVSESLYMSHHSKGAHGYGGIWGGKNASFHHNLLAHHSSRNPRFAGGQTSPCQNVDFRNNVIYNWGFNSAYGGEGGTINMVANYYKPGPATLDKVRTRIIEPSDWNGRWYVEDNFMDGAPEITDDNWAGGVQGGSAVESVIRVTTPHPFIAIPEQTAEEAYVDVLKYVGACLPVRDSVDANVIENVRTGTATHEGIYYKNTQKVPDKSVIIGIIDSQEEAGGWPELQSAAAPTDSDHDGMPDDWEHANGLNIDDASDRNILNDAGYTMLEVYLNSLTNDVMTQVSESVTIPDEFCMLKNYPNPFNPSTTLAFHLAQSQDVTLQVYDVLGRLIRTLYRGFQAAGFHEIQWDGLDESGQMTSSGLYFGVLVSDDGRQVTKMQLIR